MMGFGKLLGIDPHQYNAWEVHWASHDPWALGFLVLLTPVMLWFFWSSLKRVRSPAKKIFLFGLRLCILALVFLVFFQPQIEFKKIQSLKNSIAVLIDNSKSMSIQTYPREIPRSELIREFLEQQAAGLEALQENFEVGFFLVSDHVDPVMENEWPDPYQADEARTDYHQVFRDLKQHYREKQLQGVLLFSDGADLVEDGSRLSREFVETLNEFEGPVHTFQTGTNAHFKDLAIDQLEVADFGFVNQPISVSVQVSAVGLGDKNVPLVLREGEKILVSKMIHVKDEALPEWTDLEFTPTETGKHVYTVSLPLFSGEAVTANNRWDFASKVVRDRVRVLHLNGRPSWDSRFLREVLINNPKIDLLSFFILRTLTDNVDASTAELSLIPFPSNLLFTDYLKSFDLVIFHNFKYTPYLDKKYLANLKEYVEGGGAFLMIGGELSFQGGQYQRTPIEDIIPVRFQRDSERYLSDEFQVQVDGRLIHHPILQLEKNGLLNQKAWQSMPPLRGLNVGLIPVKGAQVLAYRDSSSGKHPVLAARQVGQGRSMIIATDSSWNWNFLRVGAGGSGRYYQKFWENIIAWMTDEPETHRLQVETDKEKYRENETVRVHLKVLREDYNPHRGAPLDLVIDSVPGKQQWARQSLQADDQGEAQFEFSPNREGFYSVRVTSQSLSGEARFSVASSKAEFQKPRVNAQFLKAIAHVTGGTHQVLGEAPSLEKLFFPNPIIESDTSTRWISLWDNWGSYGLILGLLSLEWWLRRKSGLS